MSAFKYQGWHVVIAAICILGLQYLSSDIPGIQYGELFGMPTRFWFWLAVLSPIVHQFYVSIAWRCELFGKNLTSIFGMKAFSLYRMGFTFLILARPVSILCLAISNKWTLDLDLSTAVYISIPLTLIATYTGYSVFFYFGIDKAYGLDHFMPDEAANWQLIDKGIFRFTNNAMYLFGFCILYVPGLVFLSKASILIALFNHGYIWVHYYLTEKPDMKIIYTSLKP